MDFDLVYRLDFPRMCDILAKHEGDIGKFVAHLQSVKKIGNAEMHTLMHLAMAASYDPDPAAPFGIRLPVDQETCQIIPERWERWLAHDPLRMIDRPECRESLCKVKGLFIDCGFKDQYYLHYGARAFVRKLQEHGIEHLYEEFDDTHSGIDYRMDRSLPFMYEAVK
jgi:hypothetical protein